MGAEIVGWLSSLILVVTVGQQVYKQWREGVGEGVSRWLFAGQIVASAGFVIYSWSMRSWVFVLTNGLMLVNGAFGLVLVVRARRRSTGQKRVSGGLGAPGAAETAGVARG